MNVGAPIDTDLHSNMFLLILRNRMRYLYNAYVFTFQYVSINTKKSIMDEFNTLVFTFQYVSINTKSSGVYNVLRIFIYIPICFY